MQNFLRKLPPMSSLRPFEAAARHENFTLAAEELFVTQAAVSKQIRLLEEHLGVALFIRNGRNLELTAAGRDLHHAVAKGLDQIAGGSVRLRRETRRNRVTIAMRLPFANQFLSSRLRGLFNAFPDVEFNFQATEGNPAHLMDYVDLAVVLGNEPQPYITADHLITEEIMPVCSPGYLRRHPELRAAQDLPSCDLLHLDAGHWRDLAWSQTDWPVVLSQFGVPIEGELAGPSFNSFEMLINAAIADMGVAIGWHYLVDSWVQDGRLIFPVEDRYKIGRRHYLLSREAQAQRPLFQTLRAWFLDETREFRA